MRIFIVCIIREKEYWADKFRKCVADRPTLERTQFIQSFEYEKSKKENVEDINLDANIILKRLLNKYNAMIWADRLCGLVVRVPDY
jgi:hypothetical protein